MWCSRSWVTLGLWWGWVKARVVFQIKIRGCVKGGFLSTRERLAIHGSRASELFFSPKWAQSQVSQRLLNGSLDSHFHRTHLASEMRPKKPGGYKNDVTAFEFSSMTDVYLALLLRTQANIPALRNIMELRKFIQRRLRGVGCRSGFAVGYQSSRD